MTLLDDLTDLDLSGVLDAKASIELTVSGDDVTVVISGGVAQALGELGGTISALQDGIDDPSVLLAPLGAALDALLGELDLGDLPVGDLLDAVREAATLLAALLGGGGGDLTTQVGSALVGALGSAAGPLADFAPQALDELGRYRTLIDSVESGLPTDPPALARFALDLLLPGPRVELEALAREVRVLRGAAEGVTLRIGATNGLVTALDAVTAAAAGGDAAALSAALATVQQRRASVLSNLEADLQRFAADVTGLRVEQALAPLAGLAGGIHDARDSVVEQLDAWRQQVADIHGMVTHIDVERIVREVPAFIDQLEALITAQLDAAVDAQVQRLAGWLRELFAHLPLRALRAELSAAIDRVAAAVTDAGLDLVVRELRAALDAVEAAIGGAGLAERVQAAIGEVEATIAGTIDTLVDQLGVVTEAVEDVAEEAGEVLDRAVVVLEGFRGAVDAVVDLVDEAGIEAAGQQVVTTLAELREVAEELLSVAPLPDALRPIVDQLVATLDAIDIDALVREPLTAAAKQLAIPDQIAADVSGGLAAVAEAVGAVIPQQLVADLDAAVDAFVQAVQSFDPASLLGDLTGFLEEAARFVEELDPRPLAAELRPGFSAVLGAVDAAHPRRLLAPVIDAYTDLLGGVALPEPATSVRRMSETVDAAGEAATTAASQPMTALAPDATVTAPTDTPAATPPLPGAADLRAGDIVRLFGWVPEKLRAALAALDAAGMTAFLSEIDALVGGLAAELRAVAAALVAVEARLDSGLDAVLAPVATAQVRAQLALQASASAGGGATAGVDVDLSLEIVASVGPGPLRSALASGERLARDRTVAAAGALTGATANALLRAADTLERCALARLVADADAFLAALDPEPIAAEIDALIVAAIDAAPAVIDALGDTVEGFQARIDRLLGLVDPGRLVARFLPVLDVFREQLDLVDPRRLADELGEVHAAVRAVVAAYDPEIVADEIYDVVEAVAAQIRALDPAELIGDLAALDEAVGRIDDAVPSEALAGLGADLEAVGDQLLGLDVEGLLDAVEDLPQQVVDAASDVAAAVIAEIKALLESIRYTSAHASASVSVGVSVG